MAADRDSGPHQSPHLGRDLFPALDLDRLASTLLHQPSRVLQSLGRRYLIGQKGHVRDQKSVLRPAPGGPGVMDHVGHGHRHGGIIAKHDHPQRIADQDDVDPRFLRQTGRWIIIGRQHDDLFTSLLHPQEVIQGLHEISPLVFI